MLRTVFLLVAAALVSASLAIAQPRIALVIGNSDYDQPGWDLRNPANDAQTIARALTQVGFEVHVLADLTQRQMEDAFIAHGNRLAEAGEDAIGFVFYAGHGVQADGLNFLIPTDAEIFVDADVYAQAPRLGNLFRNLERAGNATNFVVLDACRNNPMPSASRSAPAGLASTPGVRGTLIAYATQPGAVADDGAGNNSPYTEVLAQLIPEPGLSAEDLFRRAATQVEERTGLRQQPWTESGLRGDRFCFAGCAVTEAAVSEDAAFGRAVAAGTPSAYNGFLAQFPNSRYRSQIEALSLALASAGAARAPGLDRTTTMDAAPSAAAGMSRATPPPAAVPTIQTGEAYGVTLTMDAGGWIIRDVAATSPFKGKLLPGDVLNKIDGTAIASIADPANQIDTIITDQGRISLMVDRNGIPFSIMVR